MKKNLHINKQLYRDGLRQLRLVGIMGMVIFCLASLLTVLGYYINYTEYMWWVQQDYSLGIFGSSFDMAPEPEGVMLYQVCWILFAAFPVLTPVLTLMMFNFLNHRNASDFYHSIPDTRGTLYLSYGAAIVTWLLAIVGVSTAIGLIGITLNPGYFVIWSTVPKGLFMILSCCVLVMGGISIAMSLTGTRMSNLAVSVMILFLPRIFITSVTAIIAEMLGFVEWNYSSSLINGRYNLLVGMVLTLLTGDDALNYWSSGLYTLVLGLIYLVIGYVLFLRRKSESAGHAAISRKLQTVFRLAVSMTICLIPIFMIMTNWESGYGMSADELFSILVLYVVAVVAYFVYELITTGKLRRIGRLFRELGFLVIGNVLLIGLMWGVYGNVVNFQPEGEDIDYIRIIGDSHDYFQVQLNNVKIRDDEVAELTAKALKRTIAEYTNDHDTVVPEACVTEDTVIDENFDKYQQEQEMLKNRTIRRKVAINCGMKTVYRRLIFLESEWETIAEHFNDEPEFRQVYLNLPELSGNASAHADGGWISSLAAEKVYEVMREEVREIDFVEWYMAVEDVWASHHFDVIRINVEMPITGEYRNIVLPILNSMERTKQVYMEQMKGESPTQEEKDIWSKMDEAMRTGLVDGKQAYGESISVKISYYRDDIGYLESIYRYMEGYFDGKQWNLTENVDPEREAGDLLNLLNNLYQDNYVSAEKSRGVAVIAVDARLDAPDKTYRLNNNFMIEVSGEAAEELEKIVGYSFKELE